jgi:hypothetical protein
MEMINLILLATLGNRHSLSIPSIAEKPTLPLPPTLLQKLQVNPFKHVKRATNINKI